MKTIKLNKGKNDGEGQNTLEKGMLEGSLFGKLGKHVPY